MANLYYIGWYIANENDDEYVGNIPAKLKMRYIKRKMLEANKNPIVYSLADPSKQIFCNRRKIVDKEGTEIIYSIGIKPVNKVLKKINRLIKGWDLKRFINANVKKNDTVVFYHSGYSNIIKELSQKKGFKVVLELEEIYGFSALGDIKTVEDEIELVKSFESYIFVNDNMPLELGLSDKESAISYGVIDLKDENYHKFSDDDGKIHVVYAGTIELKKHGALTAVEVARHLPENYMVHILGFGSDKAISILLEKINSINSESAVPKIQYDGFMSGEALDDYLSSCDIGLSCYVVRESFSNNSLPSKVTTYMCHGLSVVIGYTNAYDAIAVAKNWSFYKEDNPESIANAIRTVDLGNAKQCYESLRELDKKLVAFFEGI